MTKVEWLGLAKKNSGLLTAFIASWHPILQSEKTKWGGMHITAPNAERACIEIRKQIVREEKHTNPVREFNIALTESNVEKIYTLLNSAWFGVPESRDCWQIEGFRESVELLEDMPDDFPSADYEVSFERKN